MSLIPLCAGILLIISLYGQCLGYEQTECSPVASCYPPCKLRTKPDGCKICKCPKSTTTTQSPYSGESEHPEEGEDIHAVPVQPAAYDHETPSPYYAQENTPQYVVNTPSTSYRTVVYYPTPPAYVPPAYTTTTYAPAYSTAPVYGSAYTPSYQTQPIYPSLPYTPAYTPGYQTPPPVNTQTYPTQPEYAPAYPAQPAYTPGYQTPPPVSTQTYPTQPEYAPAYTPAYPAQPVYTPAYPSVTSSYQTPAYGITPSTSSYTPVYPAPEYTSPAYTAGYGTPSQATYSPGYPTPGFTPGYTASTTPAYQTPAYTPAYGAAPSPAYQAPPTYAQSYDNTPGRTTTQSYPGQPTPTMNPNLPPCPGVVCPEWCRSIYDKQLGYCVVDCICS